MKILFITNMYPSKQKAYAGIFVKNQFEHLKQILNSEDELEIFYMKRSFTSKFGSLIKYSFAFIKFLPKIFKKYDIIHVHYFYPLILLAWLNKKVNPNVKIVVTFLGRDINSQVNDSNKAFYKKIARSVDFSIPVGETLSKQISLKLNLKEKKILPCGVNDKIFYKDDNVEKEFDFIMVGSFIHRKGIDTVIKAIKLLPEKSNIKFCFCGSGEYLNELQNLKRAYKITIKQNQTQNQIRELLNKSRFFLLMSRAEGFATATTEAFFCGVPVLTSDIDNFKEQVDEGVNGFTSRLNDEFLLKDNFLRLNGIDNTEYAKLADAAYSSFRSASLKEVCKEIYKIYKNLKTVKHN